MTFSCSLFLQKSFIMNVSWGTKHASVINVSFEIAVSIPQFNILKFYMNITSTLGLKYKYLLGFTKEILNGKLHLCAVNSSKTFANLELIPVWNKKQNFGRGTCTMRKANLATCSSNWFCSNFLYVWFDLRVEVRKINTGNSSIDNFVFTNKWIKRFMCYMATSLQSEFSIIFKVYTWISAKKSKPRMQRQNS